MSDSTRRTFLDSLAAPGAMWAQARVSLTGSGAYIGPRKVLLWESTRKEFREALEGGALQAMIVPLARPSNTTSTWP
jgi:hypothetical protein